MFNRVLGSYTFRFYLIYAVSVGLTAFFILGIVYASFSYGYFNEVHNGIIEEVNDAEVSYQTGGIQGFEALVRERTQPGSFSKFYYILVDDHYQKLAGNLDAWPRFNTYGDGWLSFERDILQNRRAGNASDFVGRSVDLDNGHHLLAARHYNDVIERIKLVAGTLSQSILVTILLGALGGAYISASFQSRLEDITRSIHTIMTGHLSERIPVDSRHSEFEELVINLNNMLDRIEQLMAGVRQVSDNIAHDLRTPLTRLRNNLALLQRDASPDQEPVVESLIIEAEQLLTTFNALLRIAQVESGNRRAGFADVALDAVLADVVELYEPLAAEKNLSLTAATEAPVVLKGDKDLLFQMLVNLVDNAIKYSREAGVITVTLRVEENSAALVVADTGPGIPEVDRDRVFQRFYRVEASRSREPGNGLGLSLVWAVVKLHGADIELQDNHPGLRVVVRFPLA